MANRTTLVINAWVGETKRCNLGLALDSRFGKTDWMDFTVPMVLPNAKVSDGSQPPGASASPLGVPTGARSLNRLVRLPSAVPGEAHDNQDCQ